jgi:DNA helicase-2/ATP-dependent DNA helicase PcrA
MSQVLQVDEKLLSRLQEQWPYVLEDEAQDSSHVQQQMVLTRYTGHRMAFTS